MQFYFTALKRCENWIPDQFGSLHRRPGTRFAGEAKGKPCFYRFEAAQDCPVMVVATPECFSFWVDGAQVAEDLDTPYGEGEYCELQYVEDCGAAFIVHPNHPPRILQKEGDGFALEPLGTAPYGEINSDRTCQLCLGGGGSSGGDAGTLVSPQALSVGDVLQANDADSTVFTVAAVLGAGNYEITSAPAAATGTYLIVDLNGSALIGDPDGIPASGDEFDNSFEVDVTSATARLTAVGCAPFTADMVDQFIRVLDEDGVDDNDPNTWLSLRVTEFISATEIFVEYGGSEIKCTDLFQLPAFGAGEFPSSVWIHQDRLWFGYGNRAVGSKVGDFYDWEPTDPDGTVNPDNAIYTRVDAGACSEIQWMRTAGRQLIIGTTDNIQALFGAGVGGAFAADGVAQQHIQNIGSSPIRPVQVGDSLVFVDRARRRIFGTGPGTQYDQIAVSDQTLFADHIGEKRFRSIAFLEHPFPIVWATTDDGGLFSMTYWPEQNVRGWARHRLGGALDVGGCEQAPRVCDVEAQVASDGSGDILYLAVERTVGGEARYFIETLGDFFSHCSKEEEAHYLDCALPLKEVVEGDFTVNGTGPWVEGEQAPAGRTALCDHGRWYFGTGEDGRITLDTPNTFDLWHGRTMVLEGGDWRLIDAPKYGQSAEYVSQSECLYQIPCGVEAVAACVDRITGLEHLNGEAVVAYVDGCDAGCNEVADGAIDQAGCLAWVGYPYVSDAEFLPFRVSLGGTDGANDPSKVASASFYIYRTPEIWIGTGEPDHAYSIAESFEPVEMPEEFETHHRRFHSGWVKGFPFSGLGRNNDLGVTLRAKGPFPAIIRNMEATIYASGGD